MTLPVHTGVLVNTISSCPPPSSCLVLPGTLLWSHNSLSLPLLVDSGADDSFIDENLAKQARIPIETLAKPRTILDRWQTHRFESHSGRCLSHSSLKIIGSGFAFSLSPRLLPWLVLHNLQLDWATGSLTSWSVASHAHCLHSTLSPSPHPSCQGW